ncbi:hypothetical protein L1049_018552 [Liquidambar formosana]|uniref:Uncharacterized protein n=1 Tax=Liquidambar formosana TaxID=63359 RepID=A0AAP0WLV4_LIQFO
MYIHIQYSRCNHAMEETDEDLGFRAAFPALVSLTPFTPSISPFSRRLSSNFTQPSRPVPAARKLAWVSLQGRLIGAEEASSARAIGGGMGPQEAVAWELFSPIHRILIVAVIAVAVAESKKNRQIRQLKKSVELRDQVLSSMQQKLDNLCEQVNNIKDQPETGANMSFMKNMEFGSCGCWLCDHHRGLPNGLVGNSIVKVSRGDEMLQYKLPLTNEAEQEERRMSDLSDWASSVTSAADIQMSTLAIEQDIYNLKRECEEKDATIKELSTFLHSSDVVGSKRIAELEDIIRRKNMIITKLKKDMVVLEQKVVHLTRVRRPSYSSSNTRQLPVMVDNVVYDMDSTTSPSSSDSDCSPENRPPAAAPRIQDIPVQNRDFDSRRNLKSAPAKPSSSPMRPTDRHVNSRPVSPLKEKSMNQRSEAVSSSRPKQLSVDNHKKSRRRTQTESKDTAAQRRWV